MKTDEKSTEDQWTDIIQRGLVWAADRLEAPHNPSQIAPEQPCAYCRSLHSIQRCPSCGAPRTEDRRTPWEGWKNWNPVCMQDALTDWDWNKP